MHPFRKNKPRGRGERCANSEGVQEQAVCEFEANLLTKEDCEKAEEEYEN